MRIVALLAARNEELYMERCLAHLAAQGVETCVIDNGSTDRTRSIAESFLGRGVSQIIDAPYPGHFDWVGLLRLKEQLAATIAADWFIHHDADEIREAPQPFLTLREGIEAVDARDYNAINFDEFVFLPTSESEAHDGKDYVTTMQFYYFFEPQPLHRVNAWKNLRISIDLVESGGHRAEFVGRRIFPDNFLLRHYIGLSREQLITKYGTGRTYSKEEVEQRGWHGARARFRPERLKFPHSKELKQVSTGSWDRTDPRKLHAFFGEEAG